MEANPVKLVEERDLKELANWMTWTTPTGIFLGGVQNLRAGGTGYMTVDISLGEYVWISEGNDLASRNLLKKFTVNEEKVKNQ